MPAKKDSRPHKCDSCFVANERILVFEIKINSNIYILEEMHTQNYKSTVAIKYF